jgi:hypothetical protein
VPLPELLAPASATAVSPPAGVGVEAAPLLPLGAAG